MSVTPRSSPRSSERPSHCLGFVGAAGVGTTTVSSLVAARLADRSQVTVTGEASDIVDWKPSEATGLTGAKTTEGLGIDWTVVDAPSGTDAFAERVEQMDTVFVVATPETLDTVSRYQQVAEQSQTDCFLVVNRFVEADRDRLRAFEGPELAEYVYQDDAIAEAMAAGHPPQLDTWSMEAVLIEALQPERCSRQMAFDALEMGRQTIVNVEVAAQEDGTALVESFETSGYHAAYFECNCRCHEGHVLAHQYGTQE